MYDAENVEFEFSRLRRHLKGTELNGAFSPPFEIQDVAELKFPIFKASLYFFLKDDTLLLREAKLCKKCKGHKLFGLL